MSSCKLMTPRDVQLANEYQFSRKHIDGYIKSDVQANPLANQIHQQCLELIKTWINDPAKYKSKQARKDQLSQLNLDELTWSVVITTAYCQTPELIRTIGAKLSSKLGFEDRRDGIVTACELIAVVGNTELVTITRGKHIGIEDKYSESLYVHSHLPLTERVIDYVLGSQFLPPMVCKPEDLTDNHSSAYLTHDKSVILNGGYTDSQISLDVLNLQNQTALRINEPFVRTVEEMPTKTWETPDQQTNWNNFKSDTERTVALMIHQSDGGKRPLYLEHSYDKRGRIYAGGYHISTQGTAHKKASLQFFKQEHVEVPDQFKTN